MNYGVDYDGVIADMASLRQKWVLANLGINLKPWLTDRSNLRPLIGEEKYDCMVEDLYNKEGTLSAEPVLGALEAIAKMSEEGGVYIITARPYYRIEFAEEWLESKGVLGFIKGFCSNDWSVTTKSKLQICRELGLSFMVDDDLRHLTEDFPDIRKILLKNGCDANLETPEHVEFASNWYEVMELVRL